LAAGAVVQIKRKKTLFLREMRTRFAQRFDQQVSKRMLQQALVKVAHFSRKKVRMRAAARNAAPAPRPPAMAVHSASTSISRTWPERTRCYALTGALSPQERGFVRLSVFPCGNGKLRRTLCCGARARRAILF
jgi:hypothetical protein